MLFEIDVLGTGRVTLPAYGVADAEHRVEKEIVRLLPDARVRITGVERPALSERIVEEFSVGYRIHRTVSMEAGSVDDARSAAFRASRELLQGSRYIRTEWSTAADPEKPSLDGRS